VQPDRSRAALSDFLRGRRLRITPDEVGLPSGQHRRTRGLRREELAVLTGISPTWYTYLEQGRDICPSNEVLNSLSKVLRLNQGERTYLFLLASGQPPPQSEQAPDPWHAEAMHRFAGLIRDSDLPIISYDGYNDVTGWNAAAVHWYTDFRRLPPARRNLLLWQLTDPRARERLVDWEEDTRGLVAMLRLVSASRTWDLRLIEFIDHLQEVSHEFRQWWAEHAVSDRPNRIRRLRGPDGLVHEMELVVLRTMDSFNSLMLHLPTGQAQEPDRSAEPSMDVAYPESPPSPGGLNDLSPHLTLFSVSGPESGHSVGAEPAGLGAGCVPDAARHHSFVIPGGTHGPAERGPRRNPERQDSGCHRRIAGHWPRDRATTCRRRRRSRLQLCFEQIRRRGHRGAGADRSRYGLGRSGRGL
jgi:transcriptional regulator with XRE-family HTH domain